ncbi:MAG: hypothetical protein KDN19_23130, partial [Verrucomicrobiae bacterium]|nr:hypothetical protein [Verrucomicrobiae bacterium]
DLGGDDWIVGIWAISQEATFTGTVVVGFRPKDDNTEVETFIVLSDERFEGEHDAQFMVYIDNLLESDLAGHIFWSTNDDGPELILENMGERTTIIDQCPAVQDRPALKVETAEIDMDLSLFFEDGGPGLSLDISENGLTMGIITFQRCHDNDFYFEHREMFGLRRMSEAYEELADNFCGGIVPDNAKGPGFPTAGCNGDFSDDFMVIEIPVDGSTESATYALTIGAGADQPEFFGSEVYGSGYYEDFEFTCLSAGGCTSNAGVAAGMVAEINASSRLVTASMGSYIPVLSKGGIAIPSIVLTANGAGWPLLLWNISDDMTGDFLEEDVTNEGGMDLQVLSIILSHFQWIGIEGAGVPPSLEPLLPEEPNISDGFSATGHFVVGCDNYPEGYVEGSVLFDLLYVESMGPTDWFPMTSDWIFDYVNCEIRFDNVDPFGTDGRPQFYIEGTFANLLEFDSIPFIGMTPLASFGSEAMGAGWGWNPAAAATTGDFLTGDPAPVFFEPGADPAEIDVNMRTSYIVGSGFGVVISADGGMCVGGSVSRNSDGSGNDRCVNAEGDSAYAPPLFSYIIGSCTLAPNGGGLGGAAPLLLAMGVLFGVERRRRKGAPRA